MEDKSYQEMVDETFPPVLPQESARVATFIPYRSPAFKVHTKDGLANSALTNAGYGQSKAKYVLGEDGWTRVWAYCVSETCQNCQETFNKPGNYGYRSRYDDPRHDGPNWNREPVCGDCVVAINEEIDRKEENELSRAKHEKYFLNK